MPRKEIFIRLCVAESVFCKPSLKVDLIKNLLYYIIQNLQPSNKLTSACIMSVFTQNNNVYPSKITLLYIQEVLNEYNILCHEKWRNKQHA